MRELSLHFLDIARNALEAGATRLELTINEDKAADRLSFCLKDNGRGMDAETLRQATDPFFTTRPTRRQGLGLALLKEACERCAGALEISSAPGQGTKVWGWLQLSHMDRQPLGDMGGALLVLLLEAPQIHIVYQHIVEGKEFVLDTRNLPAAFASQNLQHPETLLQLEKYINDFLRKIGSEARASA